MSLPPVHRATRDGSRVAFVTCAELPGVDHGDQPLADALARRGVAVEAVPWDAPGADWAAYSLVVLRSPWDYTDRRDAFLAWAATVPALANPADVVAWNTDKQYLRDLAGLPVVDTGWVAPGESWTAPGTGEWVVKPTVSAGGRDTGRYAMPAEAALAAAHVERLGRAGRVAMVQPYLAAVDTVGETALVFTSGADGRLGLSHAIRKDALLDGPDAGVDGLYRTERITAREPSDAELAVAGRVLAAVPGGADRLLYARVDLIPGPDGEPRLLELELTEPSLFFDVAPRCAERLADGIAARL
ncbi:ATP-grasp domain-containing protein [Spirilliplanes yamanashiensis]|uniref:ATP-grasp domain-containing protein n=1 Tax=Spirilliplanes yamanashiensis TaxID=42233 RepID=A0A8J3Y8L4_9ACTN|nr:hypothetical protein [Spirilliplanes yamanashiensis]MDP9817088.1 hypothetical protein [Spirilliplanes yamanashiensis]GIJ03257.1 ATP-grasp domain-containing protein [Spirilliplanes yamanashiensis]